MKSLSVVLLSYAVNDIIYRMNSDAIDSLFKSESWGNEDLEILLIESCKTSNYSYRGESELLSLTKPSISIVFSILDWITVKVNLSLSVIMMYGLKKVGIVVF